MRTRGKVLRTPTATPGLLMIEGQQFQFSREASWKSEIPPEPGLTVSVDLDRNLKVIGVTAIPESELAKEKAEESAFGQSSRTNGSGVFANVWAKLRRRGRN